MAQAMLLRLIRSMPAEAWCFHQGSFVIQDPGYTAYTLLASNSQAYKRNSTHAGHIRRAKRATGSVIYRSLNKSHKQMAIDLPWTELHCPGYNRPMIIKTALFEMLPRQRLFLKFETQPCRGLLCWRSGWGGFLHAVDAVRAMTGLRPKNSRARKEHGARELSLADRSYAKSRMGREKYLHKNNFARLTAMPHSASNQSRRKSMGTVNRNTL